VLSAIADAGVRVEMQKSDADDENEDASLLGDVPQLFVVRIVNDECEISADSSGELLHRRGYRQEVAKAPLRETLAAAMILASGWKPGEPLVDPMCGSGTIPIEAAMIARRIAPGLRRQFQFMRWPTFDAALWKEMLSNAQSDVITTDENRPTLQRPVIRGADRDAGATAAALRNAERAGVAADIELATQPVSATLHALPEIERGEGWVITNPPYGIRVGERDLRNLYARLASVVETKAGWQLGVLAADQKLARQSGVTLRSRFETRNGGIPVSFLASERTGTPASARRDSSR
jgi:putative N6-adenine-specific DNA methylase